MCVVLLPLSESTVDAGNRSQYSLTNLRIGLRILLKTGFQALLPGTDPQHEVHLLLMGQWGLEEGGYIEQCLELNGGRCETIIHKGQNRFAWLEWRQMAGMWGRGVWEKTLKHLEGYGWSWKVLVRGVFWQTSLDSLKCWGEVIKTWMQAKKAITDLIWFALAVVGRRKTHQDVMMDFKQKSKLSKSSRPGMKLHLRG